ncbi:hypothetical protein [Desulfosediminicola ganghwensis]|uniref:hypothetical protein n=1 Tax=Desulfosediminicola ganghwensis TaxID=2569540 RepID=UPI0010ACC88F|nr:hypothetical protein [Desulfosediminicola ganghwensis]
MMKMQERQVLLTVVDEKTVNHKAFIVLVKSMKRRSVDIFNEILVLYPNHINLPESFIVTLSNLGVKCRGYRRVFKDDPYGVKFLISSFIEDIGHEFDTIVYADPDHVAFKSMSIRSQEKAFLISSEVEKLSEKDRVALDSVGYLGVDNHYNTSLIIGKYKEWVNITEKWRKVYLDIKDVIDFRFREEIAFSISVLQEGLSLVPVSSEVQGNFQNNYMDCEIFHYGGCYREAMSIKSAIDMENNSLLIDQCVENGVDEDRRKIIEKIDRFLSIIR